jgi:hypothetical protein
LRQGFSWPAIAERFGVAPETIGGIKNGKNWKSVKLP